MFLDVCSPPNNANVEEKKNKQLRIMQPTYLSFSPFLTFII